MRKVATTTRLKSDYHFESENSSGNKVDMDMLPYDQKNHLSPTELLLSSLAGCASVDLVQMLKKRKRTILGLEVRTEGLRRETDPKGFVEIKLIFQLTSPDTSQEEFEKYGVLAATKYCSVSSTLSCPIHHEFVIIKP
jgi:putative redox protein